jgi:S1-C subfamily serine protease
MPTRTRRWPPAALAVLAVSLFVGPAPAQNVVLKAEADRVALVERIRPPVVGVFVGGGVGTGVLISDDGYAITNFHVVSGGGRLNATMKCGLPDGNYYDAVLVGLDRVGDIALIRLLPLKDGQKFPAATVGDSDTVREGDWTIALGNPQRLATDFMPTVTFGMVSGVHRYQYPAGVILEYADCIQIDTAINPGSSGGPLFNMKGELVGINGRGSVVQEKRGVMNSGVGYAISINQVKNFLGHLKAGIDTDHASLGAVVGTQSETAALGKVVVTSILEESDVYRRGLEQEDELLSFAGRPITSVNQFKNVLGLFPKGWRVPLEFRREGMKKEILARLMGVQRKARPTPGAKPAPTAPPIVSGPGAKLYEAKPGFAN